MDSARLKRIITILLVTCAGAVLVYLLTDAGDGYAGASLTVINQSRETVGDLTAHLEEGHEFALGELADGGRTAVDLEGVEGESLVWISYRRPDGSYVESRGEYIEDSSAYQVTMVVQPDGEVLVELDLGY